MDRALATLDALTDVDLLDLTTLARAFGHSSSIETLDTPISPRGYRVLTRMPRLRFDHVNQLVGRFGSLQGLLAATAARSAVRRRHRQLLGPPHPGRPVPAGGGEHLRARTTDPAGTASAIGTQNGQDSGATRLHQRVRPLAVGSGCDKGEIAAQHGRPTVGLGAVADHAASTRADAEAIQRSGEDLGVPA